MLKCLQNFGIQPFMTSIIIGATTMEQLKENIESVNISLSKELMKDLNEIQKYIQIHVHTVKNFISIFCLTLTLNTVHILKK